MWKTLENCKIITRTLSDLTKWYPLLAILWCSNFSWKFKLNYNCVKFLKNSISSLLEVALTRYMPPPFRESISWIISSFKSWTATIFLHAHLQVVYYKCVKFHKNPIGRSHFFCRRSCAYKVHNPPFRESISWIISPSKF